MKLPLLSKKVLSIDFGGKEIKFVEGQATKASINITKAFKIDIPGDIYRDGNIFDTGLLASLIREALSENKVKVEKAYGLVNSSELITRNLILPKVSEKETQSMIEYQLEELLPVDPDEYVVSSVHVGDKLDDGVEKMDILLVVVPKNMVLSHLELMKELGLRPEVLDFQANAIAKLLKHSSLVNGFYNTRDMVIASVDMGYSNSKLTIVKDGKILVTRVLDIGYKSMVDDMTSLLDYSLEELEEKIFEISDINTSDDEFTDDNRLQNMVKTTVDNLIESVDTVFRYYTSRESANAINFILLQGGMSKVRGIENLFSNYFNIPSIKLKELDRVRLDGDLSSYSNAIGGLIRVEGVKK
ncbi:MAG: pilus assembly protein PilM [Tissierellaceae bacterium]